VCLCLYVCVCRERERDKKFPKRTLIIRRLSAFSIISCCNNLSTVPYRDRLPFVKDPKRNLWNRAMCS
jgi:hypothetical protein